MPDVSLSAAGHDPYLLCYEGSCQTGFVATVFGTSASAPSFAGIMALVNQKTGSRQGQANYVLYRLAAAENFSQCNASKTTAPPAVTCIFNDVTVGNNAVPGEAGYGSPSAKYKSTVGYDLATGLGSVNVQNLVNQWGSIAFTATTTTLALSPTTFIHGANASVSIAVAPTSGAGVPTGDVSLVTNLTPPLPGATAFTLNAGAVSSTWNGLPGGTYDVHAHYAGDGTFAASDSAPVTITVSPEGSTTTLSVFGFDGVGNLIPFTSQPYGTPAYLRADISGLSGHGVATGFAFFIDNAGFAAGPYSLNSEGTAATSQGIFTIPVGQHSMVARYFGDPSFNLSASAPVPITVTPGLTTVAMTSSSSNVVAGGIVTLTANIGTSSAGLRPTGTVTFRSNGTLIANGGNPVLFFGTDGSANIQNGSLVPAGGTASLMTDLPVGQDALTAQYSGDSNYAGATSPAITVNVLPDFAFAADAPSITIASPGGSGALTFTVTGQPGYAGTINFPATSCSGLPRETTCSFSPASVTGSGSTTLTISTKAAHSARLESPAWWFTSFGASFAGIILLGGASRRRMKPGRGARTVLTLTAFAFLLMVAGCGGGSSGGGGHNQDPGTPAGSSVVTVTATSGTITHSVAFTLTVQ